MRETKTLSLGPSNYQVTQLGALAGSKVLLRAGRLVGSAITGRQDVESFLREILGGISDEDLDFVRNEFAKNTVILQTLADNKQSIIKLPMAENLDDHFANRYGDMIRWLVFCFKFNFESFLAEVGDLLPQGAATAKGSESPTT
jgi:hypothetical protein